MCGLSGVVRGGRSDIELSDEILSIIPTDPFEQLQSCQIWRKERDSLATTVTNLNHEMAKQTEHVDIRTCDQSLPGSYPHKDQRTNVHSHPVDQAPKYTRPRFCVTPYISPWITPDIVSPQTDSAAGSPTGAMSSTKTHFESQKTTLCSQLSSAANSPPPLPARTPRIDGKEFIRQARSRLSYEQFRAFLANIKELNAQKQTREETLKKANEIFGTENKDLYLSFQGLVTKNKS